ncbi:MAG: OmpP1/FadL family transporter [Rhodospirillales bacterium]|nr:OmpP1/FadL family transporter [Rhodospirillales bacterium]MDE2318733.1 outer membrane protein transport protein [Rhodospirillales bacterium]
MKTTKSYKAHLLAATACGLLAALGLGQVAHASGFALKETSADALGDAFTGSEAKAYDASTAWFNPAGMALLDQNEVDGDVSYIGPSATFSGYNTNPLTGGTVRGVQGGNAVSPAASGALFGVFMLSPDWRLGLSVTAPYGERTSYPGDFVGRYQSLVSSITAVDFGVALSYKFNDHFSIGGGPVIEYFQARLTQALNVPTLSALTGQDPIADVHGDDVGVGYNIGGLYKIDDATRIGLDYHSRIRHDITGTQRITVPTIYSALSPATAALLEAGNSSATTSITMPDSVNLGIYHQITPAWAVMGSVQWTHWALLNSLHITPTNGYPGTSIVENWRNTWFVGAGTNYQLTDRIMLQAGFAYDESPVTDSNRTARVPDANHYDLGVGVQYKITPAATIEFAYGHVFTPGGSIKQTTSGLPTPSGTLIGNYSASDNSLTGGLTVKF